MNFKASSSFKYSFVCLVFVIFIGPFTCTHGQIIDENVNKLATANNIFALNLHRVLSEGSEKNVFFSPLSLSTVFGMLYSGVRGESAEELRQALGYDAVRLSDEAIHTTFHLLLNQTSKPSIGYTLRSANSILVAKDLSVLPEYKRGVEEAFLSTVEEVDFATDGPTIVRNVNDWVEENTQGMIRQMLDDVSPTTAIVLLNAVYFKGSWKIPFHPIRTIEDVFYNNGLEFGSKMVPMMSHISTIFPYTVTNDYQAVELPYGGDDVSMLILLPKHRNGLPSLERNLTSTMLDEIRRNMSLTELEVHFPRFNVEFSDNLPTKLQTLGIRKIFKSRIGDFSGISASDSYKLSVTDVIHKAKIEVNEEGTEAAASSFIGSVRMFDDTAIVFRADHPFVYFILDKRSGLIVFMGRVSKL